MTDEGTITGWIEVADSAQVLGGKLYALGLGWDSTVPGVPTAVVFKVGVPWALTNTPHLLEVRLEDIDGHIVFATGADGSEAPLVIRLALEVGRPPGAPRGMCFSQMFAFNLGPLPVQASHQYLWRLTVGGRSEPGWERVFGVRQPEAVPAA